MAYRVTNDGEEAVLVRERYHAAVALVPGSSMITMALPVDLPSWKNVKVEPVPFDLNKEACESRVAFEVHIHALRRPDIGDDADKLTEADFISDLAEDGWCDHRAWLAIWCRLHAGGELTPREREQALAYWAAGEDLPPIEYRLV